MSVNTASGIGLWMIALLVLMAGCSKDEQNFYYPTNGLVSYFAFDGDLSDKMGNTPDGVGNFAPVFSDGWIGEALNINSSGQYFLFDRSTYHSDKKFSVSTWFNTTIYGSVRTMISVTDFYLYTAHSEIRTVIPSPVADPVVGNFLNNTWMHVVSTFDGEHLRIYVNGVLTDTESQPGAIGAFPGNLRIGGSTNEFWTGSMDELFIYNRALSDAEVDQLFRM